MHASRYPPEGFAFPDGYDPMVSSIRRLFDIYEVVVNNGTVRFLRRGGPPVEVSFALVDEKLPPEWSHVDTDTVRHCVAARWNAIDRIARELETDYDDPLDMLGAIAEILDEDCGLLAEDGFPIVVRPMSPAGVAPRWNLYVRTRPEIGPISCGHINEDRTGYYTRQGAEDALRRLKDKLVGEAYLTPVAPGFEHIVGDAVTIKYDTLLPAPVPKPAERPLTAEERIRKALARYRAGGDVHEMAELLTE